MKKILSLVLTICMFIPCVFALSACGDKNISEYAWGKTFTFQGVMIDTKNNSQANAEGVKGSLFVDLIKNEYNNNNLDFANAEINEVKFNLTQYKGANANEFIKNLDTIAGDKLGKKYANFKVTLGSEEEKTITINDLPYSVQQDNGTFYCIIDNKNPDVKLAFFDPLISTDVNGKTKGCLGLLFGNNLFSDRCFEIRITIPTITVSNDPSAEVDIIDGEIVSSKVSLTYTPYLSKVN